MVDPRELLNAYLDDEVDDAERAVVEAAMADDEQLREEYRSLRATRRHVRELPLLAMPDELTQRLERRSPFGPQARPRRRSRTRAAALSALASVAFWGLLVGTTAPQATVPELGNAVIAAQAGGLVGTPGAPSGNLPDAVDGLVLDEVLDVDGLRQGVYSDGEVSISVVVLRRPVDMDSMPDGRRVDLDGDRGWIARVEGKHVLVVNRADTGYAVIGSDEDQVMAIAATLPGPSRTLWERVVGASSSTVEFIGIIP